MLFSKNITLGGVTFLAIDLTEPIAIGQKVFPGDPNVEQTIVSNIQNSEYHHLVWSLSDHHGHPHGDAPIHQNKDLQQGFEKFDIGWAFHTACMLDLSQVPEAIDHDGIRFITAIERHHIEPYMDVMRGKGAVLLRTGYDKWLEANRAHDSSILPYITGSAGELLASLECAVVGIDSLTVDKPSGGVHTVHWLLKHKFIIESYVHLHLLPSKSLHHFDLITSAVRFRGASGGIVQSYALIRTP